MRSLLVLVALAACSSPDAVPTDAASSGDASADVGIDAVPCATDSDGDGACDETDVCPDVFDPGQVDLDGDGVGWMCDPVESTMLATSTPNSVLASFAHDTFAMVEVSDCTSTACMNSVVAASAYGKSLARSDSGSPSDAWTTLGVLTPFVLSPNEILFSRGLTQPDTGVLQLSTASYSQVSDNYVRTAGGGPPVELLVTGKTLVRPENGQLVPVTTSADGFGYGNQYNRILWSTPTPGRIAVPAHTSLSTYDVASKSLTPVLLDGVPADNLSELTLLPWPPMYGAPAFNHLPWCARNATGTYYVRIRHDGVASYKTPFGTCAAISQPANAGEMSTETYVIVGWTANNTLALLFDRGGVVTTVTTDMAEPAVLRKFGTALPVVSLTGSSGTTRVWALKSDDSIIELTTGLSNVVVAAHGNTVHLAGIQNGQNASGPLILRRYREATGTQSVTVIASVGGLITPTLSTTAEGAALVTVGGNVFAVRSSSMTVTSLALGEAAGGQGVGGPRGAATVVYGYVPGVSYNPKVFAYDEPNGAPRLTALTPEIVDNSPAFKLLDPPNGESPWFLYDYDGACRIGRIDYVNGVPTLVEGITCGASNQTWAAGRRANGDLIVLDPDVIVLSSVSATKVADTSVLLDVIYDENWPGAIIGWKGSDALGPFACLASQVDRCWTYPSSITGLNDLLSTSADGAFALLTRVDDGPYNIVRTIGTGNRPQPLP